MTRIRVNCFTIAADGYGAGPEWDGENPLCVGGKALASVLLGSGENLFQGIDLLKARYSREKAIMTEDATHLTINKYSRNVEMR